MAVTATVRDLVAVARDRDLPFLAAGIAYYALASVVPLLLLALALASLVGGQAFIEAVIRNRLAPVLSKSGQQLLLTALTGLEGQVGAGIVGLAVAFWSASRVFRGLDKAFGLLYARHPEPSLLEQLRDAAVVLGLLVVAIGALIVTGIVTSVIALPVENPTAVGAALLFLPLVLVLLPIYYVLPPGEVTVRQIVPGTVGAAGGFIALQLGFLYYTQHASRYEALGFLGALLLFVTWLYFGSLILLLGATVNYVLGHATR